MIAMIPMSGGRSDTLRGVFWAAVSVVAWGTLFPVVVFLFKRHNVDPYSMGLLRFVSGGLVMLLVYAISSREYPWRAITGKDWLRLAGQSIFAAAMSILLFYGQSLGIPVVNASLLESEAPLLIFVLGVLILRARASRWQIAGLIVGLVGSMLILKIIGKRGVLIQSMAFGDVMIFGSACSWALYTILSHRTIRRIGGFRYTSWSLLFAGGWILLFQLGTGRSIHPPASWPDVCGIAYLGLVPTALGFFAWNHAQRYLSTGILAISGYFTPILTALFGWILFAERLDGFQFAGMILVLFSALIEPEINQMLFRSGRGNEPLTEKSQSSG